MRLQDFLFSLLLILSASAVAQSNPVPFLDPSLMPGAAAPGGSAFTLTVRGTGFLATSVVDWNGSPRTTTFVNSTTLLAQISASDIASTQTAVISVTNPSPGGGKSNVALFPVTNPRNSASFNPQTTSQQASAYSVAVGDTNGDGKLDAAFALDYESYLNLACYVSNGDGTLQLKQYISRSNAGGSGDVALGDFNGDRILDLVAGGADRVSIFPGRGDGTFSKAVVHKVGHAAIGVGVADFNRDGKLDVAIEDFADNVIYILLGNGDGTLQNAVSYPTGPAPLSLVVADFNRDGNLDLAVANTKLRENTVSVLLGNGDGTFQTQKKYSTVGPNNYSVASADLNGDGFPDLVASGKLGSSAAVVLLGAGDGSFLPGVKYRTGSEPATLTLADLNGDGISDIVVDNSLDGTISVLLGRGNGTFQSRVTFPGAFGGQFGVADFNNDGKIDLISADGGPFFTLYLQN